MYIYSQSSKQVSHARAWPRLIKTGIGRKIQIWIKKLDLGRKRIGSKKRIWVGLDPGQVSLTHPRATGLGQCRLGLNAEPRVRLCTLDLVLECDFRRHLSPSPEGRALKMLSVNANYYPVLTMHEGSSSISLVCVAACIPVLSSVRMRTPAHLSTMYHAPQPDAFRRYPMAHTVHNESFHLLLVLRLVCLDLCFLQIYNFTEKINSSLVTNFLMVKHNCNITNRHIPTKNNKLLSHDGRRTSINNNARYNQT